jgi:hypothetical protein
MKIKHGKEPATIRQVRRYVRTPRRNRERE